jgi:hypothetical protein
VEQGCLLENELGTGLLSELLLVEHHVGVMHVEVIHIVNLNWLDYSDTAGAKVLPS